LVTQNGCGPSIIYTGNNRSDTKKAAKQPKVGELFPLRGGECLTYGRGGRGKESTGIITERGNGAVETVLKKETQRVKAGG